MNIKDNRRVSMTKKIIKDTFIEMLEKKNIQRNLQKIVLMKNKIVLKDCIINHL